jgi:hypothetical protein
MVTRCPKARRFVLTNKQTGEKTTKWICKMSCPHCRGRVDLHTCPVCEGAGMVKGDKCNTCAATGKIARPA